MKKILLFSYSILLLACASKNIDENAIEAKGVEFKNNSSSKIVEFLDENYLSAVKVARNTTNPLLDKEISFTAKGDLNTICAILSDITKLDIKVVANELYSSDLTIDYSGTLHGLLEQISNISNYGYELQGSSILFNEFVTKSFTLAAAPGAIKYDNQITNKSKDSVSSGIGAMVSNSETSMQTAQTTSANLNFDAWAEALEGSKSLLSPTGKVTLNQTAGTLTVSDRASNVKQVERFINELNSKLSKQVALTIYVWILEITDKNDIGLNLQTIFSDSNLKLVGGTALDLGVGSMTASILDGKFKDSQGVLKALKQWGKAKQVTSAGGIIMSNQPMPVLTVKKIAYLAGVNTSANNETVSNGLTPGEVTTGFAMTVVPHILEDRKVILQYNINLSSLDEMASFSTEGATIQLPQVSTRALNQRMTMRMGQTLVLAGFEQVSEGSSSALGFLSGSNNNDYGKSLLIITIEVESADV